MHVKEVVQATRWRFLEVSSAPDLVLTRKSDDIFGLELEDAIGWSNHTVIRM